MRLARLVPHLSGLRLDQIISTTDHVILVVAATRRTALCPGCRRAAHRVQSRYHRTVADAPWGRRPVTLRLRVRRFHCDYPPCPHRIFAERFPGIVERYARRTTEQRALLQDVALALGGVPGAALAAKLGVPTSRNTLLRLLHGLAETERPTPRVLGIDDWSIRRGHTYGTILVDLERRQPVDLLPDRSVASVARWLVAHPGVEVIARDRAGVYADGARQGAPDALQVADRWHLLHNAGDAFERVLVRHASALREAVTAVARTLPVLPPAAPSPTRAAREAKARRARRQARYEEVVALAQQGYGTRAIARHLRLSPATVIKYLRADICPHPGPRPTRPSVVDPWLPYLEQRWADGCHNAQALVREITALGYAGGASIVRARLTPWRATLPQPNPAALPGPPLPMRRPGAARLPSWSPRRTRWLLLTGQAAPTPQEQAYREHLLTACPTIGHALALIQAFWRLLRERDAAGLAPWLAEVKASEIGELHEFAAGIERDRAAVEAALTLDVSNGQTEGQITKLKLLKRAAYGRASVPLLRARLLHAS